MARTCYKRSQGTFMWHAHVVLTSLEVHSKNISPQQPYTNTISPFKSWFTISVSIKVWRYAEVWRAQEKCKNCSRCIAESNFSFLSALQILKCIYTCNLHLIKRMNQFFYDFYDIAIRDGEMFWLSECPFTMTLPQFIVFFRFWRPRNSTPKYK